MMIAKEESKVLRHYFVSFGTGREMFISSDDGVGDLAYAFPFSRIREATESESRAYLRKLEDQRRSSEKLKKARR